VDSAVHSIYDGNFSFKASKSGDSESYLNITIFYRDSTISTHRTDISSSYLKEYRINLANIHPDKIIDRIRFQNSNTTTIFLDEIHLGYIYSDKAPGLSLLAVPIYWLGDIISVYLFGIDPSNHFMIDDIVKFLIIISVLAFGAFTAIKFYDLLRIFNISHRFANLSTLIFAFGSIYYVYIGTFFSHSIAASLLILAIYYSSRFRLKKEVTSLLLSSVFSGFLVVCDYILLFLLPFLVCYAFIPIPWKRPKSLDSIKQSWKYNSRQFLTYLKYYIPIFTIYILPIILCGLLVTFYNFASFGNPFKSPYAYSWYFWDDQHFAESMFSGLEVLLLSQHHGLINFMPIVLVSVIGFIPMYKKAPALASLCLSLSILIILLYSKYFLPTGGLNYGPRQIVSIVPLLVIPFGFFLEMKVDKPPTTVLVGAIKEVSKYILKIIAAVLSGISILINVAGAWVGVYPPNQDIAPIWPTDNYVGHISVLLSWIKLALNPNGELSLIFIEGDTRGFKLNALFFTILVELKETASSLLMRAPVGLLAVMFLVVLINPYFDILNIIISLTKRIPSLAHETKGKINLFYFTLIESSLLALLMFWSIIEAIRVLFPSIYSAITAFSENILNFLLSFYTMLDSIPIVNLIVWVLVFFISILVKFFILRDSFAIGNWFINISLFTLVISIAWAVFQQKNHKSQKNDVTNTPKSYESGDLVAFSQYQKIAQVLAYFYFITSLWALHRDFILSPSLDFSLQQILSYVLLYSVFILTLRIARIPFDGGPNQSKADFSSQVETESSVQEISTSFRLFKLKLISIVSIVITAFCSVIILRKLVFINFSISEFAFIIPSLNAKGIDEWFIHIEHPVIIFLTLGVILIFIMTLIPIYEYCVEIGKIPRLSLKKPDALEQMTSKNFITNSAIQSIFLLGSGLIFFIFLLILTLFSVLSTVPDPNLLTMHLEEWLIWYSIFIVFLLGMIWAIDFHKENQLIPDLID
jgi:hypothetical protein